MAVYKLTNRDDRKMGKKSADVMSGRGGNDTLMGMDGADSLYGGEGNDSLDGGARNDHLRGEAGDDTLLGGTGNDSLDGGEGSDLLDGGAGSDTLTGSGADTLRGGDDDDVYRVAGESVVIVESATRKGGNDRVVSDVSLSLPQAVENLTLSGEQALDGIGNTAPNRITGNGADNALSGLDNNDTLIGNAGDDVLTGGGSDDDLDGGSGVDQAVYAGNRADYRVSYESTRKVWLVQDDNPLDGLDEGTDLLTNIETLSFADGTLDLNALGLPVVQVGSGTISEGNDGTQTLMLEVVLSAKAKVAVSVDYSTRDGTATAGADYLTARGTLTFKPGETRQGISLAILGDSRVETDETIHIDLANPVRVNLETGSTALATIQDDDALSLAIEADKTLLKAGDTSRVRFSFSDVPEDFTETDVTVSGASLSPFSVDETGLVYSSVLTPEANRNAFTATLLVATGQYRNALGKPGPRAALNLAVDTAPPTLDISLDKTRFIPGDTAVVTFGFSEAPLGFANNDIVISGGTLGALRADDSRTVYTAIFTPTPNLASQPGRISVPGRSWSDAAGNPGSDANPVDLVIDTLVPEVSIGDVTLMEGDSGTTQARLSVTLSSASSRSVSVGYVTQDVTAKAGTDYTRSSGIITFEPGQTLQTVTIPVLADRVVEDDEVFDVVLNRPVRALISRTEGSATVTLGNDDVVTTFKLDATTPSQVTEGGTVSFRVVASAPVLQDTLLNYAVSGTELPGVAGVASSFDYAPSGGRLTLAEGATTASFDIRFSDDGMVEEPEGIKLVLLDNEGSLNPLDTRTLILQDAPVKPLLTLDSDRTVFKAGENATVRFVFNTVPVGFAAADVSVTGGRLTRLIADDTGLAYTSTFIPLETDNNWSASISIRDRSYTDRGGITGAVANTLSFSGDTLAPAVVLTADKTLLRQGDTAALTFTFSEAPVDFTLEDLRLKGGTLADFKADASDATVYRAVFTPQASNTLAGFVSLINKSYSDTAGNTGSVSGPVSFSGDTQNPAVTVSSNKTQFRVGDTAVLTFKFDEKPFGFDSSDVQVSGGTLAELEVDGSDNTLYRAKFTPLPDSNGLNGSITVEENSFGDAAGNLGKAANTLAISGDTLAPTLSITSDRTGFKAGDSATLTFAFSEPVSGFGKGAIVVTGGTLGELVTDDGKTYTATFTPTANTDLLSAGVAVTGDRYRDLAGNSGITSGAETKTGNPLVISGDTKAPGVAISSDKTGFKSGETATLSVRFSEPVTGFEAADLLWADGVISNLAQDKTDASLYQATLTPKTAITNLNSVLTISPGSYRDVALNEGMGATLAVSVDTRGPDLLVTSDKASLKPGDTATVTFTFSEQPVGFSQEDITLEGGVLAGNLSPYTNEKDRYVTRIQFVPDARDGLKASVSVAANSYTDLLGNSGPASNILTMQGDTRQPTLTISSDKATVKSGETALLGFSFSEVITGFTLTDIGNNPEIGTITGLAADTSNKVYTATYTPKPGRDLGKDIIQVTASGYVDVLGNTGLADSLYTQGVDTRAPSVVISSDTFFSVTGTTTATVTFNFDETPRDFALTDINVSGGSLTALVPLGAADSRVWAAVFTPLTAGTDKVSIRSVGIAAGSYTDAVGNPGNTASLQAASVSVKSSQTTLKQGETAILTFTFSDVVKSFSNSQVTVTGGSLGELKRDTGGKIYSGVFTPESKNGYTGTVSVPANSYSDVAGNSGSLSNELALTGDTLAPAVTIQSDKTSLKSDETASLTFSFSEPVTGFTVEDVTVSGGTLADLVANTDKSVYTATLTPLVGKDTFAITAAVTAGSYSDTFGNSGSVGSMAPLTVDTLGPALLNQSIKDGTLILNFSESVQALYSDGSLSTEITPTLTATSQDTAKVTPQFRFSATTITVAPSSTSASWSSGEKYTLTFPANSLSDRSGNPNTTQFDIDFMMPDDTTPPLLLVEQSVPGDNATDVRFDFSLLKPIGSGYNALRLVFNEPVRNAATSQTSEHFISIQNADDATDNRTIGLDDADQITFEGNTLIIKPKFPLRGSSHYYLWIDYGMLEDYGSATVGSGNKFRGITDASLLDFSTWDNVPPSLVSSVPADNDRQVLVDSLFVLNFSEPVKPGSSGLISLVNTQAPGKTVNIDIRDTSQVTISGNRLSLNPVDNLAGNSAYYMTISPGALLDLKDNPYPGTSDSGTLDFTTLDNTLKLLSSTPLNGSTEVGINSVIELVFTLTVQPGAGSIILASTQDTRTLSVADTSQVRFSGNTVTINPSGLQEGTTYSLQIASGVIRDLQGGEYPGIGTGRPILFTTLNYSPSVSTFNLDDAGNRLNLGFSEAITGTGSFVLNNLSTGSSAVTYPATGFTNVESVSIDAGSLTLGSHYLLDIPASSFRDRNQKPNPYGYSFGFTRADSTSPTVSAGLLLPTVTAEDDLVIQFDEPVQVQSGGTVTLVGSTSFSLQADWFSGSLLRIPLSLWSGSLAPGGSYSLSIAAGAITDLSGNPASTPVVPSFNPVNNALPATNITATVGNDTLYKGGSTADSLDGQAGNDSLYGGVGNDTLLGGVDNDWLYGGADRDSVSGGAGNDPLYGEFHRDTLSGGDGADTLLGGGDDDALYGDAGNDTLNGGQGKDTLNGGDGDDVLVAGAFYGSVDNNQREYLFGGTGNDLLLGSDYSDFLSGDDGADTLEGGSGHDNLAGGTGNDRLLGATGLDTLDGGEGEDSLMGGAGDDALYGSLGHDLLLGDSGNDTLTGGRGNDWLAGGDGDDVFNEDYGRNWIDAGAGNDLIRIGAYLPTVSSEVYNSDALADTDRTTVAGRGGQDTYVLYGYGTQLMVTDFSVSGSEPDRLDLAFLLSNSTGYSTGNPFGGQGYLRLRQEGSMTLLEWDRDGTGSHFLWKVQAVLMNVTATTLTRSNLLPQYPPNGSAEGVSLAGTTAADTLTGAGVNDTLFGGSGGDVLSGLEGDDSLSGGEDNDSLNGGMGHDTLRGESGHDTLDGGYGSNSIEGGEGDDLIRIGSDDPAASSGYRAYGLADVSSLSGGAGQDVYQPYGYGAQALINDFSLNDPDKLDISMLLSRSSNYSGGDAFGSSGYLRLRQDGADTLLDWDRDGAAAAGYGWQTQLRLKNITVAPTALATFKANSVLPAIPVAAITSGAVGSLLNDTLGSSAATAAQTLYGYWGNDTLSGGSGDDVLVAGPGADSLNGGGGNDDFMLAGDLDSRDTLIGGDGSSDRLITELAGSGSLTATAFSNVSTVETWVYKGAGTASLNRNPGFSTIDLSDAGAQALTLASGFINASTTTPTILQMGKADQFINSAHVNTDIRVATLADLAAATLTGGNGVDNLTVTGGGSALLSGLSGLEKITLSNPASAGSTTLTTVNTNVAADQTLTIDASGLAASSPFIFNGTGETTTDTSGSGGLTAVSPINTLIGAFSVLGGAGNDELIGGEGNDTLRGNAGADTLTGGLGNDTFILAGNDTVQDFSGSSDFVDLSQSLLASADVIRFNNVQGGLNLASVTSGAGFRVSVASGQAGSITGASGHDSLTGANGADTLTGGFGNDSIMAGDGADLINGGSGQDTVDLTEITAAADTVVLASAFASGNLNAVTLSGFAHGTTGLDTLDIGFALQHGTTPLAAGTGTTNTLSASVPEIVADNGSPSSANTGLIFLLSGANDQLAASTTIDTAIAHAVTALTSSTDFAASGVATGDSLVLVMDDGTRAFVFHYLADATPAVTTAADLELIGILNGITDAGGFATGDFV